MCNSRLEEMEEAPATLLSFGAGVDATRFFPPSQTLAAQVWSLWARPIILRMALEVEALLHKLPPSALNNNLPSSSRRSPLQNRHH